MSEAHGVARDQLRAFVERIERLEEEKKTIADDIKEVYGEAKSTAQRAIPQRGQSTTRARPGRGQGADSAPHHCARHYWFRVLKRATVMKLTAVPEN